MKIDTSKIDGFDAMTDAEKIEALSNYELETEAPKTDNKELDKYKALLSKANSEAADYKKQLREHQTIEEKAEADRKEAEALKDARIAELEKAQKKSELTSKYMSMGYGQEEANANAEAFLNGDMDTIIANHTAFVSQVKKDAIAVQMDKEHLTNGGVPNPEEAELKKMRKYMGLPD